MAKRRSSKMLSELRLAWKIMSKMQLVLLLSQLFVKLSASQKKWLITKTKQKLKRKSKKTSRKAKRKTKRKTTKRRASKKSKTKRKKSKSQIKAQRLRNLKKARAVKKRKVRA